jgi:hypothetical protein
MGAIFQKIRRFLNHNVITLCSLCPLSNIDIMKVKFIAHATKSQETKNFALIHTGIAVTV